jgi:hypothetical protein
MIGGRPSLVIRQAVPIAWVPLGSPYWPGLAKPWKRQICRAVEALCRAKLNPDLTAAGCPR